ncbi:pentatricopeptide repeat-containing protein At1g71460, chloroplastic [Typha angustifolia]|uniref:pentatricopeptide repeat-containing protein At1g71460, chloroplastic n=1 Tax=Typha angustifolia TaxID=59011 RepID=UPI003C2D5572
MASTALLAKSLSLQFQTPNPNLKPIQSRIQSPNTPSQILRTHPPKTPKFPESQAFPNSLPLHSKNPHVIYKEVQKLARLGRLREALTVLDYLEHRGVPVNATTFSSLLSACSRCKALAFGRQIHVHIRINGLESNEFVVSKLIEMYASCGAAEDAAAVLSVLAPKSAYPWNALLKGHVVGGRRWSQGPVAVFQKMREAGVAVNEYTFSCLIKSFAGSPAPTLGMKAHALLIKNGFAGAPVLLRTCLVDMYFKCGKIRMAMKMFDEIPERDVVLWGTVIAGFTHSGLKKEALAYLRFMVEDGLEPNSVIITSVLPVIGEISERDLGREIHGYVLKKFRDYGKLVSILSGLIDMYCKCGDMISGRRVFYGSAERNAVSWTALMSGYASNGRLEQALRSIVWMQQEGIKPDVVSIATVIPVCAKLKALKQGKEVHAYAVKSWFLPNVSISTSLITMYAACGSLEYSIRVFDGMLRKNVIAWTALIDSYLKNGSPSNALDVFRSMQVANRRPDAVAISRMLSACGELRALKHGKEVHGQVLKMKLDLIPLVAAEIVNMYGRCAEVEMAQRVFDRIQSKGSLTCTAIVKAYGCNGRYMEALNLFDWMLSNGFIPNNFTFDSVFTICDKAELYDRAVRIFDSMVREYDLKPSEENYDCMIRLLTRAGQEREAQRFIFLKSTLL